MIYAIYSFILIFTAWLNKEFIDDSAHIPKENNQWHVAQFWQWVVIYLSLTYSPFLYQEFTWSKFWELSKPLISFACVYPTVYDLLLNAFRGMKLKHKSKNDVSWAVKIVLILIMILINIFF